MYNQAKHNYLIVSEFTGNYPDFDFTKYPDATLSGVISRASRIADDYLGYTLVTEAITNERAKCVVNSSGDLVIFPRKVPVTSMSSCVIELGTTSYTVSLTDGSGNNRYSILNEGWEVMIPYQDFELTGTVFITDFWTLRNRDFVLKINYTAGIAIGSIPADLKDAIGQIGLNILINNARDPNIQSASQGGISVTYKDDPMTNIPPRAKDILDYYKKVVWL